MKIFVLLLIIYVTKAYSTHLEPSKYFDQAEEAIKKSIVTTFCIIGHHIDFDASKLHLFCKTLNDLGSKIPYTPKLKGFKDKKISKHLDNICNRPAKGLDDLAELFEKICPDASQMTPPDLPTLGDAIPDLTTLGDAIPDLTTLGDAILGLTTLGDAISDLTTLGDAIPDLTTLGDAIAALTTLNPLANGPTSQSTSTFASTTEETSTPVPTTTKKSRTRKSRPRRTQIQTLGTKPNGPTTQGTSTLASTTEGTSTPVPTTTKKSRTRKSRPRNTQIQTLGTKPFAPTSTPVPTTTQRFTTIPLTPTTSTFAPTNKSTSMPTTTQSVCSDAVIERCRKRCKQRSKSQLNLGPECFPLPNRRAGRCSCKKIPRCRLYNNATCAAMCGSLGNYCRIPAAGFSCVCARTIGNTTYYRLPE